MPGVSISIRNTATPMVKRFLDGVTSAGRIRLNLKIGRAIQNAVRHYLIVLAGTRHTWATKLGGTPTGFLAMAAEAVSLPEVLSADADGCTISVYSPGMGRAFHDVTIRPGEGRQYVTIPIAGEAYGNRIRQGDSPRFPGGFFFTSKKGNLLYGLRDGEGIHPLYLLKREVHQNQDRSLLPSDEELLQAGCDALADYLEATSKETDQTIETRTA